MDKLPSERATELVKGERRRTYGHPFDNFRKAVEAFNAITGHKLKIEEGVLFQLCLKLAREHSAGFRVDYTDNVDDVAGYANVLALVKEVLGYREAHGGS